MVHGRAPAWALCMDTSVGRDNLAASMRHHNDIIVNAKALTDSHQHRLIKQYSRFLKESESWKPSWDENFRRSQSDKTLYGQIRRIKNTSGGAGTTDCYEPRMAMKYRKFRRNNPNHLPSWSEALWVRSQLSKHADIVEKATHRVDARLSAELAHNRRFREQQMLLPPISEPTPAQHRIMLEAAQGSSTSHITPRRAAPPRRGVGGGGKRVHSTPPAPPEWGALEERYLAEAMKPVAREAVDERLVGYVLDMTLSNSTNENVQRLVKQRTAARYPEFWEKLTGSATYPPGP